MKTISKEVLAIAKENLKAINRKRNSMPDGYRREIWLDIETGELILSDVLGQNEYSCAPYNITIKVATMRPCKSAKESLEQLEEMLDVNVYMHNCWVNEQEELWGIEE